MIRKNKNLSTYHIFQESNFNENEIVLNYWSKNILEVFLIRIKKKKSISKPKYVQLR